MSQSRKSFTDDFHRLSRAEGPGPTRVENRPERPANLLEAPERLIGQEIARSVLPALRSAQERVALSGLHERQRCQRVVANRPEFETQAVLAAVTIRG